MKYVPMTDDQRASFVDDPTKCPLCGAGDVSHDEPEELLASVWTVRWFCAGCGRNWLAKLRVEKVLGPHEPCGRCGRPMRAGQEVVRHEGTGALSHAACPPKPRKGVDG